MTQVASSTMKADQTAATRALLALAQERWEADRIMADTERRKIVLAALNSGLTLEQVAEAMKLSITRVHQIKNDTR